MISNILKIFTALTLSLLILSCTKQRDLSQLIDNPQLIEDLQKQIDSIIEQNYQIDRIDISTKSFSKHGPDNAGYLELMFIRAAASDPKIKYLANFGYMAELKYLNFLGYPVSPSNLREDKRYNSRPNLPDALSRLEEMKTLIPEDYKYEGLLSIIYTTTSSGLGVYELEMELTPLSQEITHPNVKNKEQTYSEFTVSRTSKHHVGGIRDVHKTKFTKKNQHSIRFQLTGDIIEIL